MKYSGWACNCQKILRKT